MATRHALTPAELGPRSSLLVQKHAEYIASFSNIWEVCWLGRETQTVAGERDPDSRTRELSLQHPSTNTTAVCVLSHSRNRVQTSWSMLPQSTFG